MHRRSVCQWYVSTVISCLGFHNQGPPTSSHTLMPPTGRATHYQHHPLTSHESSGFLCWCFHDVAIVFTTSPTHTRTRTHAHTHTHTFLRGNLLLLLMMFPMLHCVQARMDRSTPALRLLQVRDGDLATILLAMPAPPPQKKNKEER